MFGILVPIVKILGGEMLVAGVKSITSSKGADDTTSKNIITSSLNKVAGTAEGKRKGSGNGNGQSGSRRVRCGGAKGKGRNQDEKADIQDVSSSERGI